MRGTSSSVLHACSTGTGTRKLFSISTDAGLVCEVERCEVERCAVDETRGHGGGAGSPAPPPWRSADLFLGERVHVLLVDEHVRGVHPVLVGLLAVEPVD